MNPWLQRYRALKANALQTTAEMEAPAVQPSAAQPDPLCDAADSASLPEQEAPAAVIAIEPRLIGVKPPSPFAPLEVVDVRAASLCDDAEGQPILGGPYEPLHVA